MIEACRRGPALARVEAIDERIADTGELGLRRDGERFSVLPTI
jgi:acylphosphatase